MSEPHATAEEPAVARELLDEVGVGSVVDGKLRG
jgi:hypothetical protein